MDLVNIIKSRDETKIAEELKTFINENARAFEFPSMATSGIQNQVWNCLVELLRDPCFSQEHSHCLHTLKILSRDQQFLDEIVTEEVIETLLEKANLNLKTQSLPLNFEVILEAQKCLFNLVFSHTPSRLMISNSSVAEAALLRISSVTEIPSIPHEVLLFDLKILFLLTALCISSRPIIRYSSQGIHHLVKLLDTCLVQGVDQLTNDSVALCCESLKVIFNLLLPTTETDSADSSSTPSVIPEEDLQVQRRLMYIIRLLLSVKSNSLEKREDLKSQAVNLLTSVRPDCYDELAPASANMDESYHGRDMESFLVLLEFLDKRLDKPARVLQEELLPILTVLIEFSSKQRIVRKFLRCRILPPLRDVSHRPEEGSELRNKLCRLMTSAVTQVEFLVAEFLFILCKENVSRLIKYTGYGNAAGLLAHRGLMMGHPPGHVSCYSSDSEDSETEEYKQAENSINPVTGSYEAPRPNPLENMTEEQKEYEAVKLVNMIDQLQRKGIIQPARVGEDGKPHAVEHLLELQKD